MAAVMEPTHSLVIPVYGNEGSIPELLKEIEQVAARVDGRLEAVLVVDGSPDASYEILRRALPEQPYISQLIAHSRNFGSFAAIRTGLEHARGRYFATMAADLQEPAELVIAMFGAIQHDGYDVAVGSRRSREDALRSRLASGAFWGLYRRFVQPQIPKGGVDTFGCNRRVCDVILSLQEANTSLVALLYWCGFRHAVVPYDRVARRHGKSGWSLRRKFRYLADSVFSFTDLPVRLLWVTGLLSMCIAVALAVLVLFAELSGSIRVPGYAATVLIILFFASLNGLGLGIIGSYVWRAFDNTKGRPHAIVRERQCNDKEVVT